MTKVKGFYVKKKKLKLNKISIWNFSKESRVFESILYLSRFKVRFHGHRDVLLSHSSRYYMFYLFNHDLLVRLKLSYSTQWFFRLLLPVKSSVRLYLTFLLLLSLSLYLFCIKEINLISTSLPFLWISSKLEVKVFMNHILRFKISWPQRHAFILLILLVFC